MASITVQHGHKNLLFAAAVANETGAEFEEQGQWITISDSPELIIPRYAFNGAFDPEGQRGMRGENLEHAWRSLLLNKQGYLAHFDDMEIRIVDEKPRSGRPQFQFRFPSDEAKAETEQWAERMAFESLTEYIWAAIANYNDSWAQKAAETPEK